MPFIIRAARKLKDFPDGPSKDKKLHARLVRRHGEAWTRTEKSLKNVRYRLRAHFLCEELEAEKAKAKRELDKALTKVSKLEKQLAQRDKVFGHVLKKKDKAFNVALQAKEQECSLKLQAKEQQFRQELQAKEQLRQELQAKENELVDWRAALGRMMSIGSNRQAEDGGAAKRARVEAAASGAAPEQAQHLNMHRA